MYGSGPIALLFGLVVGAIYLVFQFNIMSNVNEMVESQMDAMTSYEDRMEVAVSEAAPEVTFEVYDTNGRKQPRSRAAVLLAPSTLTRDRSLELVTFIDPRDLLKEGETMPEGELRHLMVEARAARLIDEACERALRDVAADCAARTFDAEPVGLRERADEAERDRYRLFEGHYWLSMSLIFTPSDPVGTFPETNRVVLNSKKFELERWEVPGPIPELMEERQRFLTDAARRACEDIRAVYGNCAIEEVVLDHGYGGRGTFAVLRPSFTLAWFTALQNVAEEDGAVPAAQ